MKKNSWRVHLRRKRTAAINDNHNDVDSDIDNDGNDLNYNDTDVNDCDNNDLNDNLINLASSGALFRVCRGLPFISERVRELIKNLL